MPLLVKQNQMTKYIPFFEEFLLLIENAGASWVDAPASRNGQLICGRYPGFLSWLVEACVEKTATECLQNEA